MDQRPEGCEMGADRRTCLLCPARFISELRCSREQMRIVGHICYFVGPSLSFSDRNKRLHRRGRQTTESRRAESPKLVSVTERPAEAEISTKTSTNPETSYSRRFSSEDHFKMCKIFDESGDCRADDRPDFLGTMTIAPT
jgi:hypothetical protein